jgi:hypothetical protein
MNIRVNIGSSRWDIGHVQSALPVHDELVEREPYIGARRIHAVVEPDSASVSKARRALSIVGLRGGRR